MKIKCKSCAFLICLALFGVEIVDAQERAAALIFGNFQKDIYRSVQALPGIANTDFSAKPHIKGGNPDETEVLLDNMPISEPFHLEELFDGAYSIINTEQVRHLKLFTGGFSAKYEVICLSSGLRYSARADSLFTIYK